MQTVQEPGGDERTIARYNYSKFFHAINVANQDKWDKSWYLDREVEKLVKENGTGETEIAKRQ